MKVSDYTPDFYKNNLEYQTIIKIEEDEVEIYKEKAHQAFLNNHPSTANEEGIARFENILGIIPDEENEDLEMRRERIINRLATQVPFTMKYLRVKLNEILGVNNYALIFFPGYNYGHPLELQITYVYSGVMWTDEVKRLLDYILPCNIKYTLSSNGATWRALYESEVTWQDIYDENITWQNIYDGEW